jgi:hypothetical protein
MSQRRMPQRLESPTEFLYFVIGGAIKNSVGRCSVRQALEIELLEVPHKLVLHSKQGYHPADMRVGRQGRVAQG